jgi:hypothetical protein
LSGREGVERLPNRFTPPGVKGNSPNSSQFKDLVSDFTKSGSVAGRYSGAAAVKNAQFGVKI